MAVNGNLTNSPAHLNHSVDQAALDDSGSLFNSVGSRSSTPQHPLLMMRNSGQNSPAQQHSSPRLSGPAQSLAGGLQSAEAQKIFAEGTKGDLQSDAAFSDPENEAKRRIIFTISPNTGHVKQSPSSKHSPVPASTRPDGGQAHAQDGKKRGRRKRSSTGNPSGNAAVSPKRKSLPSVAGLFTQPSGSPLNINSMVRAPHGRSCALGKLLELGISSQAPRLELELPGRLFAAILLPLVFTELGDNLCTSRATSKSSLLSEH